jgi:MFS family permease
MSGVALFPQTFTVAPASVVVGILITVYGKYRWSIWAGWTLTILGCGILALLDLDTKVVEWIFLNLVSGVGTGMLFPSLGYAVQASAGPKDVAFAVAMFSFFRAFGQAFGVAIGGVIFQNALSSKLSQFPALKEVAGEYAKDAVALVEVIKQMPDGELRDQLMWSYAEGLKPVWYAMTGFAAFAGIMSLLTKEVSIDVELQTEQGLKEKKKKAVPEEEGVREKS